MAIIETTLSNGKKMLIEVSVGSGDCKISRSAGEVAKIFDKAFDKLVQNEIVQYCNILTGAFEEMKNQSIPPKKATAEFGIQAGGEGNVYLAKISAQANFKVSVEWDLND